MDHARTRKLWRRILNWLRRPGADRYSSTDLLDGFAVAHHLDGDKVDEWLALMERQIADAERRSRALS